MTFMGELFPKAISEIVITVIYVSSRGFFRAPVRITVAYLQIQKVLDVGLHLSESVPVPARFSIHHFGHPFTGCFSPAISSPLSSEDWRTLQPWK